MPARARFSATRPFVPAPYSACLLAFVLAVFGCSGAAHASDARAGDGAAVTLHAAQDAPAQDEPIEPAGDSEPVESERVDGQDDGIEDDADAPMIELRPAIDTLTNNLLDDLEAAGQAIETLQAAVIYDRRFLLQGDQHLRTGNLYFQSTLREQGPPMRRFAIAFERLFVDNVMRLETQRFVFDGRWLVERDDANKRYIAREVAPPGASFDPLRLGEGPMPIPLGQRKADILARYDARATWGGAEWTDEDEAAMGYQAAVESARQLVLTPRAQFAETDDFQEIRLWYAEKEDAENKEVFLLPVLSRTVSRGGDVAFVRLLAFKVNRTSPADVQRLKQALEMAPPDEPGWEIQRIEGRWDEQEIRRSIEPAGE